MKFADVEKIDDVISELDKRYRGESARRRATRDDGCAACFIASLRVRLRGVGKPLMRKLPRRSPIRPSRSATSSRSPPGGPADAMARAIGQKLQEDVGPAGHRRQSSRRGRQHRHRTRRQVAARRLYALRSARSPNAINQSLYRKLPFDFVRDFAPVTQNYVTGLILAVHPSLPAKSVKELIALAKSHPGQLSLFVERRRRHAAPGGRALQRDGRREDGARPV